MPDSLETPTTDSLLRTVLLAIDHMIAEAARRSPDKSTSDSPPGLPKETLEFVARDLMKGLTPDHLTTLGQTFPAFAGGYAARAIEAGDVDGTCAASIGALAIQAHALRAGRKS